VPVVLLVRHGQATYATAGSPAGVGGLSELGVRQARAVGDALRGRGLALTAAVGGSLLRQTETLRELLTAYGASAPAAGPPDPRWDEYDAEALLAAYGPGASLGEGLQARLDDALLRWVGGAGSPEGVGGWHDLQDRASAAVADLLTATPAGGTAVAVTSGGPITAIAARVLDLPPPGVVALHRVLANAGVTKLVGGRSGVSLVSVNEHAHLEGAGGGELLSYR